MIYILSVMIHGELTSARTEQIYVSTIFEAEGRGWDPVNLTCPY